MIDDSVRRKKVKLDLSDSAYVYKPPVRRERGVVDGERFTLIIKDGPNPPGTPPQAATNLDLIAWDKVFYLSWDLAVGAYDSQKVYVSDATGVVDEILITDGTLDELEISNNIVNGTEYTLYVSVIVGNIETDSSTISGTPRDKTPQNLVLSSISGTEAKLDWDDLVGSFGYYKIYIKNTTSGEIEQEIGGIQSSEVDLFGLTVGEVYEAWVISVSEKSIFTSSESNHIIFTANYTPRNFTATVSPVPPENFTAEIQLPDAPTNFTTTKQ